MPGERRIHAYYNGRQMVKTLKEWADYLGVPIATVQTVYDAGHRGKELIKRASDDSGKLRVLRDATQYFLYERKRINHELLQME